MIAAVLAVPSTQYPVKSKGFLVRDWSIPILGTGYCSSLSRDNADIGKIAIAFRIVQTVAHDEFIGNGKAHVIAL
jgi:hypothetical protein